MLIIKDKKIYLDNTESFDPEAIGKMVIEWSENAHEDLELTDDGLVHCN